MMENALQDTVFIILDTNFLLIPHQFGVDIFSEIDLLFPIHQLVVPQGVFEELIEIKKASRGKDGIAAKVGLELLKKRTHTLIESVGLVDDFILKHAHECGGVVATNDGPLKRRLRTSGVHVISYMKAKKRVAFI